MEKIIVIGDGRPNITDALREVMESEKISGSGIIVVENDRPEPIDLQLVVKEIHSYKIDRPDFKKVKSDCDWKKHGSPLDRKRK